MNFNCKPFYKNINLPCVLFCFNYWFLYVVKCTIVFDKKISHIIYSPYTSSYNKSRLPPVLMKSRNDYTIEDLQEQLSTIQMNFTSIITLGMGVKSFNMDSTWNKTNSECLISTAAAYLNLKTKDASNHLRIMQGIRISHDDTLSSAEMTNAIEAINYSNKISPQTVQSVLINFDSLGEELLNGTIRKYDSYSIALPYGIRVSHSHCEILFSSTKYVTHVKFAICVMKQNTMANYYNFETGTRICEQLLATVVQTGVDIFCEFGITTTGLSKPITFDTPKSIRQVLNDFIDFWKNIRKWSNEKSTQFVINEAFDQPELCHPYRDPTPSCQRGIWLPLDNKYCIKSSLLDSPSTEKVSGALSVAVIIVPIMSILGIVLIAVGIIFWKRKASQRQRLLNDKDYEEFLYGVVDETEKDETIPLRLPYNRELLELPQSSFTIE